MFFCLGYYSHENTPPGKVETMIFRIREQRSREQRAGSNGL